MPRYPGFGPWSHLPPWERPGWKYFGRGRGRGWCWWWYYYSQNPSSAPAIDRDAEIRMLEDEAAYLEERLREIRRRLDELRK